MSARKPFPFVLLAFLAGALLVPAAHADRAKLELAPADSPGAAGSLALVAKVAIDEGWHVNSNTPTLDFLIPTELTLSGPAGPVEAEIRYPAHRMVKFPYTDEPIAVYDGTIEIGVLVPAPAAWPATYSATLSYQACDDRQCLAPTEVAAQITLDGKGGASSSAAAPTAPPPAQQAATPAHEDAAAAGSPIGLGQVLWLALLGGLILNAMPCVLPVLSLKIFGLVKSAGEGRGPLVAGALATTFGVLVSFWVLAAIAVAATRAGAAIGWGSQFQQPGFVAFLAVVVVLFSLNMWGLFEIRLPIAVAQVGAKRHSGLAGHFTSGLFATLMATPCSAPFLGPAVGFALGQPAMTIFLVFTMVGLGLALPYLALAAFPGFAKLLPKPGGWMNTFRHVMGFFLAATAVWLFYVLASQIAAEWVAFVQLAMLAMALGAFFLQRAEQQEKSRVPAWAGIALAGLAAVLLAGNAEPPPTTAAENSIHPWVAFDEREANRLAAEGKQVFIDFTADWCLTCKATERVVINTPEISELFQRHGVVPMKADWTNRDDRITQFLSRHGRAAVPFYILYRPGAPPHVFGELLTKGALTEQVEAGARRAGA